MVECRCVHRMTFLHGKRAVSLEQVVDWPNVRVVSQTTEARGCKCAFDESDNEKAAITCHVRSISNPLFQLSNHFPKRASHDIIDGVGDFYALYSIERFQLCMRPLIALHRFSATRLLRSLAPLRRRLLRHVELDDLATHLSSPCVLFSLTIVLVASFYRPLTQNAHRTLLNRERLPCFAHKSCTENSFEISKQKSLFLPSTMGDAQIEFAEACMEHLGHLVSASLRVEMDF